MAAEGPITSGAYILHHLTYLQLDLKTWKIVKGSSDFWVVNIDSMFQPSETMNQNSADNTR